MKITSGVVKALTALWVCFLCVMIWHRISLSHQNPTFDAFEYFQKAKLFWDALASHQVFDPFSLPPTTRPPGTILMSYPFGFSEDPRPFYFRSVALAIIALVSALLLVTLHDKHIKPAWALFVVIGASALPMFYQFEAGHSPTHFFGLIDCFFAGVSALAAAAVIVAVERKSRLWMAVACLLAAYSMAVKPTGLIVMVFISFTWFCGLAFHWLVSPSERKLVFRRLCEGSLFFAAVYGALIYIGVRSGYMSPENIAFGVGAVAVLQKDFNTLTLHDHTVRFYVSFGILFPVAMVLPLFMVRPYPIVKRYGWNICCAILAVALGIWIWLMTSAGTQFRYIFPFALMALVFAAQPLGTAFSNSMRFVRVAVILALVAPPAWTVALLSEPQNIAAEELAGLSMYASQTTEEQQKARQFIDGVRQRGEKSPGIYHLGMSDPAALAFSSLGSMESLLHPGQVSLYMIDPLDWVRTSGVRMAEVQAAGYILVHTLDGGTRDRLNNIHRIDDYLTEIYLFQSWGTTLTAADGVEIVATMPSAILFKITDRSALGQSFQKLRDAHEWRPEFIAANPHIEGP